MLESPCFELMSWYLRRNNKPLEIFLTKERVNQHTHSRGWSCVGSTRWVPLSAWSIQCNPKLSGWTLGKREMSLHWQAKIYHDHKICHVPINDRPEDISWAQIWQDMVSEKMEDLQRTTPLGISRPAVCESKTHINHKNIWLKSQKWSICYWRGLGLWRYEPVHKCVGLHINRDGEVYNLVVKVVISLSLETE